MNETYPMSKTQTMIFWRFTVRNKEEFGDPQGAGIWGDILDLGISGVKKIHVAHVYYCGGNLTQEELTRLAEKLLIDPITQEYQLQAVDFSVMQPTQNFDPRSAVHVVEVGYRPGVRDPVEDSLKKGALDLGIQSVTVVHTAKEYVIGGILDEKTFQRICEKLLVNGTIQQIITPENLKQILEPVPPVTVPVESVHLSDVSETVLQRISLEYQLSLNLEEMKALQSYFQKEKREPTLLELETIAQTWSEHCKHKTFKGLISYTEEINGTTNKRMIDNLLKNTIMRVTQELNRSWCISVFEDNAGVIAFDDDFHVCFKVETHNHPSALEPFGGASTGLGGVIRDILGTGCGAKPVASTDVFCFAPPDFPADKIPPGTLQPRRVMKGVVAGVKDYGNKMGIPTVNGAVLFDERFIGNPLVYCGTMGILPKEKVYKKVTPGMKIVLIGGRTGRDGIHGATFSSLTLSTESESISSTAVQIGDAITEKKVADLLLQARDESLFASVTDCGAGGLSSAVGEMGASCGARVYLDRVPLKYAGLTPTEIWISESQERMVCAVPVEKLEKLLSLSGRLGVEATAVGDFTHSGKLELFYRENPVGTLKMGFLHDGVPQVTRPARWSSPASAASKFPPVPSDVSMILAQLLGRWDTCSKEWIIRQYDHEVQGGSALKPLVGVSHDGPSDAAIVRPRLDSNQGVILANGINFRYGDIDPYWMAAAAIDESIRQIISVGGSFDRIALLDNFCWGDPTRVEVLGSLVRASEGCYAAATAYGTPFISGKDSLFNEYKVGDKTIQIPGTLLISSIGMIPDAAQAVSMDLKGAGNFLYSAGVTKLELGGSSYCALSGTSGGTVPHVDFERGPQLLKALSGAIQQGLVLSAHDCSEGGLGVAAAEMAFAGESGVSLDLRALPVEGRMDRDDFLLFSESQTRLLLEVSPKNAQAFEDALKGFPVARIGQVDKVPTFRIVGLSGTTLCEISVQSLKEAWQQPFRGW